MPRKKIIPEEVIPERRNDGNWDIVSPRSGKKYLVLEWGNGHTRCTCEATSHGSACWHLRSVAAQIQRDIISTVRDPLVERNRTFDDAYATVVAEIDDLGGFDQYDEGFPWDRTEEQRQVEEYDYTADDFAFDAARERGMR